MTAWHVFIVSDFALAMALAFVAGYFTSRSIWYSRGYRAGTAWAGRVAARFAENAEPTAAESRR